MENLIELLKKNMVPIGLWPKFYGEVVGKAMQAKMKQMEPKDIECFLTTGPAEWGSCENFSWTNMERHISNTYRLRSDYEEKPEEPEIVEHEIYDDERHSPREAYDQPDFIGFKFDDGTVFGSPVKYSVPGETSHGYYAYYGAIKTGQALEHHATHVLFRRPK